MAEPTEASADHPILAGYAAAPGVADELLGPDGRMRPVWRPFIDWLGSMPPGEIRSRFERGDRYLRDAGVYFRQYTNDPLQERDWPLSHIPVILHESEWQTICAGLTQRADLLERVMADLYGRNRLVADGHLPAGLIAGNPQWLRPLVGHRPRGGHFLHFLAFELGRSPDGSWLVLGDRAQAPSGAGFALENRIASRRIFPEPYPRDYTHRLAGFFEAFRQSLETLASRAEGAPRRFGIMTPGPANDAYYEHTYIARYLGMPLLEGEDMLVENGEVLVRTIEGPVPLGVLWRRIDAGFADPLELDPQSIIGTPGLVEAARSGNVAMVNALGSGILESRAMMAFLPRICEQLTGAELSLPNIATWWCGSPTERAYVRENAERMMIGSAMASELPFELDAETALGGAFRSGGRGSVADWIESRGASLVGQEAVSLSTTPSWVDDSDGGHLHPCPMVVRVFAARTPQGWTFMQGGYARIGPEGDATTLAMQRGGHVADVWIMGDEPAHAIAPSYPSVNRHSPTGQAALPARAADNLFWLGRYIERFESAVRLIRAYHLRLAATGDSADPRLTLLSDFLGAHEIDIMQTVPETLTTRLTEARLCATKVRDRFSTDGWLALGDLMKTVRGMGQTVQPGDDAAAAMGVLLRKTAGFSGIVHENMYRTHGWRFLSIGRALERADALAALLAVFADPGAPEGSFEIAIETTDAVNTHRARFALDTNRDTVVDLLALDGDNPRSIHFQVAHLKRLVEALPGARRDGRPADLLRTILPLDTRLQTAGAQDITVDVLSGMRGTLAAISDQLTAVYLR